MWKASILFAATLLASSSTVALGQIVPHIFLNGDVNGDNSADADGNVSKTGDEVEDRWGDLAQSGIAPEAVILFPETSVPACIVGVESCGVSFTNNPVRTFWNQRDTEGTD